MDVLIEIENLCVERHWRRIYFLVMLAAGLTQLMLIMFVTFQVSFVFSDYYLLKRERFISEQGWIKLFCTFEYNLNHIKFLQFLFKINLHENLLVTRINWIMTVFPRKSLGLGTSDCQHKWAESFYSFIFYTKTTLNVLVKEHFP